MPRLLIVCPSSCIEDDIEPALQDDHPRGMAGAGTAVKKERPPDLVGAVGRVIDVELERVGAVVQRRARGIGETALVVEVGRQRAQGRGQAGEDEQEAGLDSLGRSHAATSVAGFFRKVTLCTWLMRKLVHSHRHYPGFSIGKRTKR